MSAFAFLDEQGREVFVDSGISNPPNQTYGVYRRKGNGSLQRLKQIETSPKQLKVWRDLQEYAEKKGWKKVRGTDEERGNMGIASNMETGIDALEPISKRELDRRRELEKIIETDMAAFLRVGHALKEICDCRLYRSTHLDFREYLKEVWDLGKSQAYRLIDSSLLVEQMSPMGDILPKNERQVRPLLKYKDDPEKAAEVWQEAVKTATNGKVTAKHVQQTLFKLDGENVGKATTRTRSETRSSELPESFVSAVETLLQEIELLHNKGWKNGTRAKALGWMQDVTEAIGRRVTVPTGRLSVQRKDNLAKITAEGFRIFRRDAALMVVEELDAAGDWTVHKSFEDPDEVEPYFADLLTSKWHLEE